MQVNVHAGREKPHLPVLVSPIHKKPPFWWAGYIPAASAVCLAAWLVVWMGGSVLIPLLLGFALSFMLEPLVARLERFGMTRHSAVLAGLATAFLVVTAVLVFLLPSIFHQIRESLDRIPLAAKAIASRVRGLLAFAQQRLSPDLFRQLQDSVEQFEHDPSAMTSRVGGWLSKGLLGLVSVGSTTLGLVIVPFFVYYLLLDLDQLKNLLESQIPVRHRGVGTRLFDEVGDVVRGYVQGRFLIAAIMASIYAAGLLLLQVPLWAGIGLIAGIIGIIPYLGVTSGMLLALGFAALDGAGPGRLLGVVAVFFTAQMIEDYVLTPRIIGGKLELHPMLVFIALIVAGDLYGLLGLVLAIPALAVLKVFVCFFDELYLRSDFYSAPATDQTGRVPVLTSTAQEAAESVST